MLTTRKKRKLKKTIKLVKYFVVLMIALLPLIIYLIVFNHGLSSNSQDWGAFGSFVGGIYAPIAAIISVYVLIKTLQSMDYHNKESQRHQNKDRHLENIRWLTDLLRDMLNKKYTTGHGVYYTSLKLMLKNRLEKVHNPDNSIVKNKAIELMKENKEIFQDECIIFDDLFYRVTHYGDIDDGALSCMILIAKLSQEERFWLMQYAKAYDYHAAKDLKFWRAFEDIPTSLASLVKP